MKALISPNEVFTHTWVTAWKKEGDKWVADTEESIQDCIRVAQVEPNDKVFQIASPLYWLDCPNNCKADEWYFKNGLHSKPVSVEKPEND